jgi:phage regulator Rha-like protein
LILGYDLLITPVPIRLTLGGKTSFHLPSQTRALVSSSKLLLVLVALSERALALPHTLLRENTDAGGLNRDYLWDNRFKLSPYCRIYMSDLFAFENDGELVVDSRLIAPRLGIEHDNFMQTINTYQTHIEKAFGIILFQTGKSEGPGRPQKYAFLTENQSSFLMTLSRNTPEVVQCKTDLVLAFSKARELLREKQKQTFNDYTLARISLHHSSATLPLPDGYFSCFDKMIEILQRLDVRLEYQLGEQWYDRRDGVERYLEPDISLGRHFSQLFTSNHLEAEAKFESERQSRASNPRISKFWNQKMIDLRWKADRAATESQLRFTHLGLSYPVAEDFIDRRRYVFKPAPNGNRPDVLDAYCYSNNYTSLFYDWLRQVFFRFCWKSYITERDLNGWMMRYQRFQSLPERERQAILTTSEGGMISGFEFPEIWRKQILPGDE